MKIPSKIQVGGTWYDIVRPDRIEGKLMGTTNYATTFISLAKYVDCDTVSEESRDSTFFHELVHCILGEMGHELNNNEEFVQTVSTFVNQITKQMIEANKEWQKKDTISE